MKDNSTILIVDDNTSNIKLLVNILSYEGYRTRTALNGLQALESIEAEAPDLILLDIQMPKLNGYETCAKLKVDDRFKHIPVIFISAMTETFNKVLAFDSGGSDYIQKPFDPDEVLARVRTHLELSKSKAELESVNTVLYKQLKSTFNQAAIGIAHLELETLKFKKVNERLCQILGYDEDELLKKNCFDITPKDYLKSTKDDHTKMLSNKTKSLTTEKTYIRKDGSLVIAKCRPLWRLFDY